MAGSPDERTPDERARSIEQAIRTELTRREVDVDSENRRAALMRRREAAGVDTEAELKKMLDGSKAQDDQIRELEAQVTLDTNELARINAEYTKLSEELVSAGRLTTEYMAIQDTIEQLQANYLEINSQHLMKEVEYETGKVRPPIEVVQRAIVPESSEWVQKIVIVVGSAISVAR
ncbi:MAG: hypothetical protein IH987_04640 [Planctomycetes bacterium]|nr:hypothetical protein [Planctomycetota bacterium]